MFTKEEIENIISNPIQNTLHPEAVFENSSDWIKKKHSSYCSYINNSQIFRFRTNLTKFGSQDIGMIKNPILIIDLGLNCFETKYTPDEIINLFNKIKYQILGYDVEQEIGSNWIKIMLEYYNLKVEHIGSKIFIPLPFNLLVGGFCPRLGGG